MKATEVKLMDFLRKSPQFIVPIYQRTYSWTERECRQLWEDILRTGKDDDIPSHFIGSVVYIEEGLYQVSSQSQLRVIDGQQRLTTVSLIIEALARQLGDTEPLEGFSTKKLRNYYLLNPEEKGDLYYKLLLTQTDKQSFLSLISQKPYPSESSLRIKENFDFFEKQIKDLANLQSLCKGLAKLIIVDISLNRNQDNSQLIFESMNSTGRELSQADLIRNFILMGLETEHQTKLYESHWRPMEVSFGQEAYSEHFDLFMRHYLTIKTGKIPKLRKVYEAFKESHKRKTNIDSLVEDIHTFANYYCAIVLNKETNKTLKDAFIDLKNLKVNVSYPFILQMYHDYKNDILSEKDFEYIVRLVESYVFRRAVCGIQTNSLNKTFAAFNRVVKKDHYKESVEAHFLLQTSYRRFPKNNEFFEEIQIRDLYNFHNCRYLLRKLENYNRKEQINVNEYTIEHILPQNENLSSEWRKALGPEWKQVKEEYLHTLGNLTLTGYNSEYRDKFFTEKSNMKGGFKKSPLHLNEGLGQLRTWNEETIKARAKKVAEKALKVWPTPSLPSNILNDYHSKKKKSETFSVEHYPHLSNDSMRSLFESFRKEMLALNVFVEESFKPQYISYEMEKIFVYLLPQRRKLKLFLGLQISELDDPKRIAKDARDKHYGSCNVEVDLNSLDQLPYIMGLVRQVLDKQTDNDDIQV